MRRLGITGEPGERIVIYGEDEGLLAARVFVALDSLGLAGNASLLDGQWAGWQAEGRLVTTEVLAVAASSVEPRVRGRSSTAARRARACRVLGTSRGRSARFWKADLQTGAAPRLRPAYELRARYAALGVAPDDVVVAYCRTGVQASYTYFVLAHLGYDVRLYDGSFVEWSAAPDTPVARP